MTFWTPRPSPNHGAVRARTRGIIIHSTRGGASSFDAEFEATCAWFANPSSQVSAHRVIGYNGEGAVCVGDGLIAWHAGEFNSDYLSVELVQPYPWNEYSDSQYRTLSELLHFWCEKYNIPYSRKYIIGHDEVTPGKTDPGDLFEWDRLFKEDMPMDKEKLIYWLNSLWEVREGFNAGAEHFPLMRPISDELFNIIVGIKEATRLQ